MARCDYCGRRINELPFHCKFCGKEHCSNHRLPEEHKCVGIKGKSFFKPLSAKSGKRKHNKHKEDQGHYEMYVPGRRKHSSYHSFSRRNFSFKRFLRKYVYFRIQDNVKPYLMQFLLIFLIGIVLNYVYYQTFSLTYLFIGGINEWFSVLMPALNYGLGDGYNLFYLIINGIYYAYFYYSFVLVIYHTITNLDKRNTWVMLGWFALIVWALIYFFPQIV